MAADPFWRWAGRYLSETTLVALYRASFFYGVARWTAWLLWAHVVRSFAFDLRWGGPRWVPRIYADELNQAAPAACRCAGCCSMTPRLGFYGVVAVCAWVKGHSGVRETLANAPSRPSTTASPPPHDRSSVASDQPILLRDVHRRMDHDLRALRRLQGSRRMPSRSPSRRRVAMSSPSSTSGSTTGSCSSPASSSARGPSSFRESAPPGRHSRPPWRVGSSREVWYAAVHPESYPSVGDVGFIGFYPLTYLGIVALLRARTRSIGGTLWLDGLTASLAAAALGAAVLVELVLRSTEGSTSTVATNLAYPLGDLLLLSAVFGVFSLTRWRPGRRWLLLGLGVLATTFADAVYLFQSAAGTYVEGSWVDILWPVAAPPHRVVGVGGRPERRGARGGRQAAPRGSGGLRLDRDRRARLRPLRAGQRPRRRPRGGHAARGRRPPRRHVPREPPALRADPARRRSPTR